MIVGPWPAILHRRHLAEAGADRHLEEEQPEDGRPADDVAEAEELLGGELPVGELRAEEQRDQRPDVERAEDQGVLPAGELEARDVVEPRVRTTRPR